MQKTLTARCITPAIQASCVGQHGRYSVSIDGRSFVIEDAQFNLMFVNMLRYALTSKTSKIPDAARARIAEIRKELTGA